MVKSFQIIPAILATTPQEYQDKLLKIEDSGVFEDGWVQIDLMDKKFVQNQSVGPDVLAEYSTNLRIEAQLMVIHPQNWIDELVKIKVDRIVFPVEDFSGIEDAITQIKNLGMEVGLSLNPDTPIEQVLPYLEHINLVLIMSVQPGFGGQKFIPKSLKKIQQLASHRDQNGLKFVIEVDGGINQEVIKSVVEAGASNVVIGSHLIDGDITQNLESLWQAVYE